MSYLPDDFPVPPPTRDEQPFWDFCAQRELRIQQCTDCGRFRHTPQPVCPACRSFAFRWTPVTGDGTVYSYTVVHHATSDALAQAVPYNVAVVMLDGAGAVRLVSNIVDAAPGDMRIGMRVQLCWEEAQGRMLPRFRRTAG